MLPGLRITNFRTFRSFTIDRLARVNLFVGTNNAGKTCVLDAAEIVATAGDPRIIWRGIRRHDEIIWLEGATSQSDVSHLFHGHELRIGARFTIESDPGRSPPVIVELVSAKVSGDRDSSDPMDLPISVATEVAPAVALRISSSRFNDLTLKLSSLGGLSNDTVRSRRFGTDEEVRPAQFLGTQVFEARQLGELWDELVLTPEEANVVDALKIIEPRIERIAFGRGAGFQGSFYVKMSDSNQRVPLGSMGDGVKRLLALSLNAARAAGGYLFLDEIDTGLHYSVMLRMWRLVIETAKRLDVQVFATTHSLDCINALAELYERLPELGDDVLLHRIERGEDSPMTYTGDELRVAAEQHMEVR